MPVQSKCITALAQAVAATLAGSNTPSFIDVIEERTHRVLAPHAQPTQIAMRQLIITGTSYAPPTSISCTVGWLLQILESK